MAQALVPTFRLLVFGGRDFSDEEALYDALDRAHAKRLITTLIHGGAPGADTLAGRWAADRGVPAAVFPADWRRHGRAAGPIRNEQLLRDGAPDSAVAIPGGKGNMAGLLRAQGVPVWEPIRIEEETSLNL